MQGVTVRQTHTLQKAAMCIVAYDRCCRRMKTFFVLTTNMLFTHIRAAATLFTPSRVDLYYTGV